MAADDSKSEQYDKDCFCLYLQHPSSYKTTLWEVKHWLGISKADRPHPCDYPHTPTDYSTRCFYWSTVVKKRKLTARKVQNIFSLCRGVPGELLTPMGIATPLYRIRRNSWWRFCIFIQRFICQSAGRNYIACTCNMNMFTKNTSRPMLVNRESSHMFCSSYYLGYCFDMSFAPYKIIVTPPHAERNIEL